MATPNECCLPVTRTVTLGTTIYLYEKSGASRFGIENGVKRSARKRASCHSSLPDYMGTFGHTPYTFEPHEILVLRRARFGLITVI